MKQNRRPQSAALYGDRGYCAYIGREYSEPDDAVDQSKYTLIRLFCIHDDGLPTPQRSAIINHCVVVN